MGTQITFPFDTRDAINTPRDIVDPGLVEEIEGGGCGQETQFTTTAWHPRHLAVNPRDHIFCSGGTDLQFTVPFRPRNDRRARRELSFAANSHFKGVIIVIGNGTTTGAYTELWQWVLDGYVTAVVTSPSREMSAPSDLKEITLLNNFYDTRLWSWRELYH